MADSNSTTNPKMASLDAALARLNEARSIIGLLLGAGESGETFEGVSFHEVMGGLAAAGTLLGAVQEGISSNYTTLIQ